MTTLDKKCSLMVDKLWWKRTVEMEDHLWWKTIFGGRGSKIIEILLCHFSVRSFFDKVIKLETKSYSHFVWLFLSVTTDQFLHSHILTSFILLSLLQWYRQSGIQYRRGGHRTCTRWECHSLLVHLGVLNMSCDLYKQLGSRLGWTNVRNYVKQRY